MKTFRNIRSNFGKLANSTLNKTDDIVNAVGNTTVETIKLPGAFASTATKGFETVNTGLDIAQKLGIASKDASIDLLNQGLKITNNVSDNADTVLKTTKTLLKTGNDVLEKMSPHIGTTSGNAAELSAILSGVAVDAVNTSAYLTKTLLSAIKFPFKLAQKKENPRTQIENEFNTIKKNLSLSFTTDLQNTINLCNTAISLFQTRTCKRTRFFSLNCSDSQDKIDSMKGIKLDLELKIKEFKNKLISIFQQFTTRMEIVSFTNSSSETLFTNANEIKTSVVSEASTLFNTYKALFLTKLELITTAIEKYFDNNFKLEGGKQKKRRTKRHKSRRKHRSVKRV